MESSTAAMLSPPELLLQLALHLLLAHREDWGTEQSTSSSTNYCQASSLKNICILKICHLNFTRKFTQAPLNQSRLDFRDGCDDAKDDGDDDDDQDDDRSKGNPELIMTGGHPL